MVSWAWTHSRTSASVSATVAALLTTRAPPRDRRVVSHPPPSSISAEHVIHLLLRDAVAAVDPHASPELAARQIVGYVQRHHHRLDEVVGHVTVPSDLAGLVAVVRSLDDVTLDFSATALRGRL